MQAPTESQNKKNKKGNNLYFRFRNKFYENEKKNPGNSKDSK